MHPLHGKLHIGLPRTPGTPHPHSMSAALSRHRQSLRRHTGRQDPRVQPHLPAAVRGAYGFPCTFADTYGDTLPPVCTIPRCSRVCRIAAHIHHPAALALSMSYASLAFRAVMSSAPQIWRCTLGGPSRRRPAQRASMVIHSIRGNRSPRTPPLRHSPTGPLPRAQRTHR